jgi:hypothetical protein
MMMMTMKMKSFHLIPVENEIISWSFYCLVSQTEAAELLRKEKISFSFLQCQK